MKIKRLLVISLLAGTMLLGACNKKKPTPSESSSTPSTSESTPGHSESTPGHSETSESTPGHSETSEDVPVGTEVDVYLVLTKIGLYKGEKGQNFPELFLENAVKLNLKVGDALPGKDDVTATSGSTGVFLAWVDYNFDGAPTSYTKVPGKNPAILQASWTDSGEPHGGGESGGGESGGGDTMPTSGYGLYFSETKYAVGVHLDEKDHGGRDQYLVSNLSFVAGETFQLYDFANKAGWVIAIDPYSFGANGEETKVAEYVTKDSSTYSVVKDFTADVYIKLKYQDDQIYFGLK